LLLKRPHQSQRSRRGLPNEKPNGLRFLFGKEAYLNKRQLRNYFLDYRLSLTVEQLEEVSQAIRQTFFDYFKLDEVRCLHIFLPILRKNEINTWLIIERLRQDYPHLTLVVPRSHLPTGEMASCELTLASQIVENRWGIPEPIGTCQFPEEQIDMVLLPLLGFDKLGFRVGYGGGFYDRFLREKCRAEVIKVGLALAAPVETIDDVEAYDIKMDFCVTGQQVFSFQNHRVAGNNNSVRGCFKD